MHVSAYFVHNCSYKGFLTAITKSSCFILQNKKVVIRYSIIMCLHLLNLLYLCTHNYCLLVVE